MHNGVPNGAAQDKLRAHGALECRKADLLLCIPQHCLQELCHDQGPRTNPVPGWQRLDMVFGAVVQLHHDAARIMLFIGHAIDAAPPFLPSCDVVQELFSKPRPLASAYLQPHTPSGAIIKGSL